MKDNLNCTHDVKIKREYLKEKNNGDKSVMTEKEFEILGRRVYAVFESMMDIYKESHEEKHSCKCKGNCKKEKHEEYDIDYNIIKDDVELEKAFDDIIVWFFLQKESFVFNEKLKIIKHLSDVEAEFDMPNASSFSSLDGTVISDVIDMELEKIKEYILVDVEDEEKRLNMFRDVAKIMILNS